MAFALAFRAQAAGDARVRDRYFWRTGDRGPVAFRRGTSDVALIYDILLKPGRKSEYWLPRALAPATVLDIGANIGITSRYLAHRFPGARIHAFEPEAGNLALLRSNAAQCDRIAVHPFALGAADGELVLRCPDPSGYNRGGHSAFAAGGAASGIAVPVRSVAVALAGAGIESVDVIKIDTEGAEFSILSAFPEPVLSGVAWIYGELHREAIAQPTDFRLLDYLSRWFEIAIDKPAGKKNYFFDACRKDLCDRFGDFRRYR